MFISRDVVPVLPSWFTVLNAAAYYRSVILRHYRGFCPTTPLRACRLAPARPTPDGCCGELITRCISIECTVVSTDWTWLFGRGSLPVACLIAYRRHRTRLPHPLPYTAPQPFCILCVARRRRATPAALRRCCTVVSTPAAGRKWTTVSSSGFVQRATPITRTYYRFVVREHLYELDVLMRIAPAHSCTHTTAATTTAYAQHARHHTTRTAYRPPYAYQDAARASLPVLLFSATR